MYKWFLVLKWCDCCCWVDIELQELVRFLNPDWLAFLLLLVLGLMIVSIQAQGSIYRPLLDFDLPSTPLLLFYSLRSSGAWDDRVPIYIFIHPSHSIDLPSLFLSSLTFLSSVCLHRRTQVSHSHSSRHFSCPVKLSTFSRLIHVLANQSSHLVYLIHPYRFNPQPRALSSVSCNTLPDLCLCLFCWRGSVVIKF